MIRWMLLLGGMVHTMFAGKVFDTNAVQKSIDNNIAKYYRQYKRFTLHTSPDQIQQISDPYICVKLLQELNALRQSVLKDLHDCGQDQEEVLGYTRDVFEGCSALLHDQLDIIKAR